MNKIKETFIFFAIILFTLNAATNSCASEGYNVNVQVHGVSDTVSYLAFNYGDSQYLKDTADVDIDGRFTFLGEEKLPNGMYMIVMPGNKYFEVIINENQHFEIETEMDNLVKAMQFKDSPENSSFYEYLTFVREKREEVVPIRGELRDSLTTDERREILLNESKLIDQLVEEKQKEHIENFPDCVFSMMLKAQRSVPRPETIMEKDENIDFDTAYKQYKNDFWKYIDLSDERILYTPIYHSKLETFFENVVIKHPDSTIKEVTRVINKTKGNDKMFQYTLSHLGAKYERSEIMGMDAVFVHLVNEYYKTGKAFWIDDDRLERIIKRAERLEPILIGKTAPDIKMYRPDKSAVSLHDVEAKYTVIYFWDSDCPACKRKTPKVKDFYENFKEHDVKIFAVNTEIDRENWLNYIEENEIGDWLNVNDPANISGFRDKYDIYSIPVIFFLDEDKKIIAKRINVEQVKDILSKRIDDK